MFGHRIFLSVFAISALSLSCGGAASEASDAEDADESVAVTTAESALSAELSDEVAQPVSMPAEEVANAAATRIASGVQPAGCLTKTVVGSTVTYVFNNCTGRYGLVKVTGTITAVYSRATGGGIQVVATGKGMKANNVTFDLQATVKATQTGNVKKAEVVSDSTGSGPRGAAVVRQGNYTATYDAETGCVTLDGTWETTVALRKATTTVTNFKTCKGQCPAAGGSISHKSIRNVVVTVTYDGTATAAWTSSPNNRSGTVKLLCGS